MTPELLDFAPECLHAAFRNLAEDIMVVYSWESSYNGKSYESYIWRQGIAESWKVNMHLKSFSRYIPIFLSIVLSLPTLLGCVTFWFLIIWATIIKDTRGTILLSVWNWLPSFLFVWLLLFVVFGPIFACVLCTIQITSLQQESTGVANPDKQIYRMTKATLLFAAGSICFLILTGGITHIMRGLT